MAKTTIALITFLVLLAAVLVGVAVKSAETPVKVEKVKESTPTPTPKLMTKLYMFPNPVTLSSNTATVKVLVDASAIDVSSVQLEISYNPMLLSLQSIRPSKEFSHELPVVNSIDKKNGRASYLLNRSNTDTSLLASSSAEVATMFFTKIGVASGSATTDISFLPKSFVSSRSTGQPITTTEGTEVVLVKPILPTSSQIPRSVIISPTR